MAKLTYISMIRRETPLEAVGRVVIEEHGFGDKTEEEARERIRGYGLDPTPPFGRFIKITLEEVEDNG